MLSKTKIVSSLDLKYLGSKFITIPDSHLEMSSNMSDIRRTRDNELPSILKTMQNYDQTTLQEQLADSSVRVHTTQQAMSQLSRAQSIERHSMINRFSEQQKKQISKYRNLIHKIKQDNQILHKQITNLYRQKKIYDCEPKTKAVKTILKAAKQSLIREKIFHMSPQTKLYDRIYQNLGGSDNPYRKQSFQIQKKFSSSNLHKNFEAFLISHNRRIPQFIKKIR